MKQTLYNYQTKALTVAALCILQLMNARILQAQKAPNINININDVDRTEKEPNIYVNPNLNVIINTPVLTGPNGRGAIIQPNIRVIDNGTPENQTGGPNVNGNIAMPVIQQQVVAQAVTRPKAPKPVVSANKPKPKPKAVASTSPAYLANTTQRPKPKPLAATSAVQRPKPKPKTNTVAQKRTVARPVAPLVAAPAISTPVTIAQAQPQVPVNNPVILATNQAVVVQQAINAPVIVQTTPVSAASAPVISTAGSPAVRSSAASGGSGSSGKSHRSGRKKHGSFYYNTNKKMMKLFAKTKNRKFDPAKCFVWK